MVLSALVQFLKRVCILVIGLFRLTYRKVKCVDVIENIGRRIDPLSKETVLRVILIKEHHTLFHTHH